MKLSDTLLKVKRSSSYRTHPTHDQEIQEAKTFTEFKMGSELTIKPIS